MSREEELEQMALEEIAQEELDQEKAPVEQAPVEEVQLSDPMMGPSGGFDVPQELQNPEADEAFNQGMIQGIPFAKDLYTSFQTMASTGFQDFGENKNKNQLEWEDNYQKMYEKYPAQVNVGDLTASTIGFSAIPSGILPMTVYGMFSGASRTPTREVGDVATGAAIGGAVSLALPVGLKGLGKAIKGAGTSTQWVGKKLGILSDEFTKVSVGGHTSATLSKINQHVRKFGTKGLSEGKQTTEFVKRISSVKVEGKPLLGKGLPQTFKETARKAGVAKSDAGVQLGNVVKQMDDAGVEALDGKVLEKSLKEKLLNTGKILHREDAPAREQVEHQIQDFFSEKVVKRVPQVLKQPSGIVDASGNPVMSDVVKLVNEESYKAIKYSASDLQKLKVTISNELRQTDWSKMDKALSTRKVFLKAVRATADEALIGMEKEASALAPELSGLYRKANTHFADMSLVETLTQKAGDSTLNVFSKARAMMAVKGMLAKLPNTSGANKASAVAVAGVLGTASAGANASPKAQQSMKKVSEYITNNPDSEFLKRVIVGATMSDRGEDIGEGPFKEAISSVSAEISLLESPIKRNLNDIKLKSDLILETLQFHSPEMANAFRSSLIDGDEEGMRMMIDQASKMKGMQDIFEDGKGIDGRVFSEEDKQQLEDEVEAMDISYIQKLKHKKNLKLNGTIPQIEQEPERFFTPQYRDKDKPKY